MSAHESVASRRDARSSSRYFTLMEAISTANGEQVEQLDGSADALLLRIPDAARLLGVGRTTLYKLIDDGEIHVMHIGRAVRIPMGELHDFVARQRGDRS